MEAEFMADALDDLRDDAIARAPKPPQVGSVPAFILPAWRMTMRAMVTYLMPLDADIASLCDTAAGRVYTGYMPAEQRKAVRHRLYSDGLRTAPRRMTVADKKARAEAKKWGLA